MKELFICYTSRALGYFVEYKNGSISLTADNAIRKLLGMDRTQYKQLFNKYNPEGKGSSFFVKQEDCQRLCDYLNETYGPMIKLTE